MVKRYTPGQPIEFKAEIDVDAWLPGTYREPSLFSAWHVVTAPTGETYELPARRVRPDKAGERA